MTVKTWAKQFFVYIGHKSRFSMGMKFAAAVVAITLGLALNAYTNMQRQVSAGRLAKSQRTGCVYQGTTNAGAHFEYRYKAPTRVAPDAATSNEVALAFRQIADAYNSGDVCRMQECIREIPMAVTNMPDKMFAQLARPVAEPMIFGFLNPNVVSDFSSVSEFEAFAQRNIDLVAFLGGIYIKREQYDGIAASLEAAVLDKLLTYKGRFHTASSTELESSAEKFIADWHRQIESDDSFTRQCMWFQVDLQWAKYKDGSWTLKQLSDWAKRGAAPLTRLGYTPKWLSEFDDLSEAVK